jgi:hypothetical protein
MERSIPGACVQHTQWGGRQLFRGQERCALRSDRLRTQSEGPSALRTDTPMRFRVGHKGASRARRKPSERFVPNRNRELNGCARKGAQHEVHCADVQDRPRATKVLYTDSAGHSTVASNTSGPTCWPTCQKRARPQMKRRQTVAHIECRIDRPVLTAGHRAVADADGPPYTSTLGLNRERQRARTVRVGEIHQHLRAWAPAPEV